MWNFRVAEKYFCFHAFFAQKLPHKCTINLVTEPTPIETKIEGMPMQVHPIILSCSDSQEVAPTMKFHSFTNQNHE